MTTAAITAPNSAASSEGPWAKLRTLGSKLRPAERTLDQPLNPWNQRVRLGHYWAHGIRRGA
jgi:hypothetical protein